MGVSPEGVPVDRTRPAALLEAFANQTALALERALSPSRVKQIVAGRMKNASATPCSARSPTTSEPLWASSPEL